MQCFHCNEPADGYPPVTLELDGEVRHFCCEGCKAVCQTIRAEGLEDFYQHRTAAAVTPKALARSEVQRLKELDHELVQASFVSDTPDGTKEAQLLIGGITCAACIWLLENHMAQQPGVRQFTVNHTTQRARLCWAPDDAHLSDLLIAIHELGYTARPYQADEAEQALKAEQRSTLIRLTLAGVGTFQSMMLAFPLYFELVSEVSPEFVTFFRWFSLLIATPVVFYSARPFFTNALRDLRTRHLTMDVPVAIAIGLAYGASAWVTVFGGEEVYFESVCMFTFFLLLGRFIETRARYRAGLTGSALGGFRPDVAARITADSTELVPAHSLSSGDRIRIRPGEILPVDGIIISGHSTLDEAVLTGEYLPETRTTGDQVFAGSVNGENPLDVEVTGAGEKTRLSGILRILDRVQSEKPPVASMADRIAGKFVARVLILAPLVWIGWALAGADNAFDITLSVLVVTCPCALSLATPTAITTATVKLRRIGFLPTRGHTLETLNEIDTIVFDKTGTLTNGRLELLGTRTFGAMDQAECLRLAAGLEQHSEHPIARVFHEFPNEPVNEVTNQLGGGLRGIWRDNPVFIGHRDFVAEQIGLTVPDGSGGAGMEIWLATAEQWLACFSLDDQPRTDARATVQTLESRGIRTLLLSGDRSEHVQQIARAVGIGTAIGRASPEDKLATIRKLADEGHNIMMVGDGLNDLPSMAGARVSVAMGSAADLTQLQADAVLLGGQLTPLADALETSHATRRIIRQNMGWALGYNLLALPLAAAGMVAPWLAAIGMSVSSLVVVLNALRIGGRPATPDTGAELGAPSTT